MLKKSISLKKKTATDPNKLYTLKERLIISILSAFTPVFVIMLFGPIDIFANNMNEMPFGFFDFFPGLLPYVLIVFIFFTAYLPFIKSTLINFPSALLLILPVCGCFQMLVFGSTGEITGDKAQFSTTRSVLITLFWVIVASALIIAAIVLKKKWKKVLIFITVLLVGMNGASLIADFMSNDVFGESGARYTHVLSEKDVYSLSSKENIVVLLVDRLDNYYIDHINKTDPGFVKELEQSLDGFTYYKDTISTYGRTYPSVPYMLTGIKYLGQYPPSEYLNTAYKNSNFLNDLRSNGYSVNLYLQDYYTYTNGETFVGVADNVQKVTGYEMVDRMAAGYLLQYSLMRYVPQNITALSYAFTKRVFLHFAVRFDCEDGMYYSDDAGYYKELSTKGLSLTDKTAKNFTFLHLNGAHAPYNMDENGMPSEETDAIAQIKGCMRLVFEYVNQMKKLGVFDNSTIIVAGDHGFPVKDYDEYMKQPMTTGLFVKPRNAPNGMMKYSSAQISHENLQAAIIEDAKISTKNDYGRSLFDIPEGEDTVRFYYKMNFENSSHDLSISKYKIVGKGNEFSNWKYDGLIKTEQDWY